MSTHKLEVRPSEAAGWDILHDDDPDAITNVATKEEALRAAEILASEEHDQTDVVVSEDTHELSDTGRGVKVYAFGGLALLTVIVCLIVFTGWLSNALNI